MDIKLDARNLIEADVKSALTDLDWFGKACPLCPPLLLSKRQFFGGFGQEVNALYAGKQTETELDVAAVAPGSLAFPAAVEGCPGLAVHRPLRGRDGIPELADEEALDPLGPCKFCPTTLRSRACSAPYDSSKLALLLDMGHTSRSWLQQGHESTPKLKTATVRPRPRQSGR